MNTDVFDAQRRQLLKAVGVFFACYGLDIQAREQPVSAPTETEKATLSAFVDVLIPRDRFSGSASDLQVERQIWLLAESSDDFRRLLVMGCEGLNQTGGAVFAELDYQQQYTLVSWMAESDWNHIPRRFYEIVRDTALSLYYAQPEAWQGLAIDSPPQPVGYPPPWR